MRIGLTPIMLVLALAGCGKAVDDGDRPGGELRKSGNAGGPDISPTAAPGVAFTYQYRYRLDGRRVAGVQEAHAQACETLGVARCRITGMRYQVIDADQIAASLSLKLAPDIARKFGREAARTVESAKGMVVDTEIGGTDVGTGIAANRSRQADLDSRIAALDAQRIVATGAARSDIAARVDTLRAERQEGIETRADQEEALASTPMTFTYDSGGLIPGLDVARPLREAARNSGRIVIGAIAFLIQLIALVVPFAILFAFGWWLRDRWRRRAARIEAAADAAEEV